MADPGPLWTDSKTHVENWYFCHSFLVCAGSVVFQRWFDEEDEKRQRRNFDEEKRISDKEEKLRCDYVVMNPPISYKCWTIFMAYIYTGVMSYDCEIFGELVDFANLLRAFLRLLWWTRWKKVIISIKKDKKQCCFCF